MNRAQEVVLVFDCGATNVRVIAMNANGKIVAGHSLANNTLADPNFAGGIIWDVDQIWEKLCIASQKVVSEIKNCRIVAVTVTTFGVDGTLFDSKGKMLYPVISWQCSRTAPIMNQIERYLPLADLYGESGVYPYNFNTINKLLWFRNSRPELLSQSGKFLFISSILAWKLSGEMVNETTMAGTSMLTSLHSRAFSPKILDAIGVKSDLFGKLAEPGTPIGTVSPQASADTAIPKGVPVCLAGHDTQFALFGSGSELNEPVLSSGTWEILMVRGEQAAIGPEQLQLGITTELDALPSVYDIGLNWIGSGLLEWSHNNLFCDISCGVKYEEVIKNAETVAPGSNGVQVNPAFFQDAKEGENGSIRGLTLQSTRFEIYRAILEALSYRLKDGVIALQKAGNFQCQSIRVVGGGSKNRLWNQIRADVCSVPIQLIDQKETTVLGAALFAFAGIGYFGSADEARRQIEYGTEVIYPSANCELYGKLYDDYKCK